jgi:uncharacterized C2H2 Zn-finger protein
MLYNTKGVQIVWDVENSLKYCMMIFKVKKTLTKFINKSSSDQWPFENNQM